MKDPFAKEYHEAAIASQKDDKKGKKSAVKTETATSKKKVAAEGMEEHFKKKTSQEIADSSKAAMPTKVSEKVTEIAIPADPKIKKVSQKIDVPDSIKAKVAKVVPQ